MFVAVVYLDIRLVGPGAKQKSKGDKDVRKRFEEGSLRQVIVRYGGQQKCSAGLPFRGQ